MMDEIREYFSGEGFIMYDGFDRAVLGIEPNDNRVIYSYRVCIEILMDEQEMSYIDAVEFFNNLEFNQKIDEEEVKKVYRRNFFIHSIV